MYTVLRNAYTLGTQWQKYVTTNFYYIIMISEIFSSVSPYPFVPPFNL